MRYPNITPYKGEIRKIISVKVSIPIDNFIDDEEISFITSDEEVIYLLIYKILTSFNNYVIGIRDK